MARSLGYELAPRGNGHFGSRIDQVGLLVKVRPHEAATTNAFYAPVIAGIEEVCRRQQIHLLYANLPVDEHSRPLESPRLLQDTSVGGLLVVGLYLDSQAMAFWRRQGVPIVLVDAYDEQELFDAVVTDNQVGAYTATRYLIDRGHRRIALLGSSPDAFPSIQERRAGYTRAMVEAGLEPIFLDCMLDEEPAQVAMREFLEAGGGVSAVVGANDLVALAAMRTAQKMGKRVPEDISFVGFDDIAPSRHVTPPLTTMEIDKLGMGRMAVQLLMYRSEYPDAARACVVLRPRLIERQSVRIIDGWLSGAGSGSEACAGRRRSHRSKK